MPKRENPISRVNRPKMKIYLYNLGCARNIVDGEAMQGLLEKTGHTFVEDAGDAGAIIVNTCSFIEPAAEESVDAILEMARLKSEGSCSRLIVTGCLPERYRENLAAALPEVDAFLGTGAYDRVERALSGETEKGICLLPDPAAIPLHTRSTLRARSTHPACYVKIMEGCNRRCTYCIIPKLRGRLRSRTPEDIGREVRDMAEQGAPEIVIIGQDTTSYGDDLDGRTNLADLLALAAKAAPDAWIRFLYGHPDRIDDRLLETVRDHPNICPYFDIPVQHVSRAVLKRMGRGGHDRRFLEDLFSRIRDRVPDAALRTTVMTGFPGETEADFNELSEFVKTMRFDHLGAFVYSDADDLVSHRLAGHVPAEVAKDRMERLMTLQAEISLEKNEARVGQTHAVLLEENQHDGTAIGRTMFQAPEVDGITVVYASSTRSPNTAGDTSSETSPETSPETSLVDIGDFIGKRIHVTITQATEYDLEGVPA